MRVAAAAPDARMAVAVLGPLRLRTGQGLVNPRSRVSRRVLATLALGKDNEATAEALSSAVWGHATPMSRSALQVAVHRCRQLLVEQGCEGVRIETTSTGYRLDLGEMTTDVAAFAELIDSAPDDLAALERALALWRGPVLADAPGLAERLQVRITALERQRRQAVLDLARAAVAAGEPGRALVLLEQTAGGDPLDEQISAAYIEALAATGRPTDAVGEYQRISAALAEELGLHPGPQLRSAYERHVIAPDAGHRPVQGPCQLPSALDDFTGRESELRRLAELLRRRRSAIVVTGAAGVGKTALAVQAASAMRAHFPEAALYCDLQGFTRPLEPAEALSRFLRALGVRPALIPAQTEERAALLRAHTAGSRVLVVADNVSDEMQVRPLMPGIGGTMLITSRAPLEGLEGAARLELHPFAPGESTALIGTVIGADRARGQTAALQAIAGYCGHLPLAVRIAAARLAARPQWPVQHLADVLADERSRLGELRAGDLDVRTAIELSYRHLSRQARLALRMISHMDAADLPGWVCGEVLGCAPPPGDQVADSLVQHRLLEILEVDALGQVRYGLHDLVRAFARERSLAEDTAEERAAALGRVGAGWLLRATAGDQALRQQHRQHVPETIVVRRDPGGWFERERAGLAAAVAQGQDTDRPELAWKLVEASRTYLELGDPLCHLEFAMQQMALFDDGRGRARVLSALARHSMRQGQAAQALELLADARPVVAKVPRLSVQVLHTLAQAHAALGQPAAALAATREALQQARGIGAADEVDQLRALESELARGGNG